MLLGQGEFGNVREVTEICDQAGNRDLPQLLRRLSTQNLQPQNPPHQRQVSMDVSFLQNHSRQSSSGGGPSSDGCRWQPSMGLESMIFEHDDHYEMLDESENTAAVAANRQENVNDDDNNEEGSMEMKELEEVDHARRARKVLKKRCWRDGKARYAVKQLRDDLCDYDEEDKEDHDHQHRTIGAMDLAMEAKLLASFSHPNICKLRGTAGVPGHPDYMLILDRLYMTLDEKIDEWRDELKKGKRLVGALTCQALFGKLFMRERTVDSSDATAMDAIRSKTSTQHRFGQSHLMFQKEQMLHRLYAAFDVARALRHLHRHKLLYRDLKVRSSIFSIWFCYLAQFNSDQQLTHHFINSYHL